MRQSEGGGSQSVGRDRAEQGHSGVWGPPTSESLPGFWTLSSQGPAFTTCPTPWSPPLIAGVWPGSRRVKARRVDSV